MPTKKHCGEYFCRELEQMKLAGEYVKLSMETSAAGAEGAVAGEVVGSATFAPLQFNAASTAPTQASITAQG